MRKECLKLIYHLYEKKLCAASQLAEFSGVSVRTIRNYISMINSEYPNTVISTVKGYTLADDVDVNRFITEDIPQTSEERVNYIIKELCHAKSDQSLNIYDLCEDLYVSLSTIKVDIKKIRQMMDDHNLQLKIKRNELSIVGSEVSKRNFFSSTIYNESEIGFINLQTIQDNFPDIDITFIYDTVLEVLSDSDKYANEFSLINLVLHIAITMDRIMHHNLCESYPEEEKQKVIRMEEYEIAKKIGFGLSSKYGVFLSENELYELTLLVASRISTLNPFINDERITAMVKPEIQAMANDIIQRIRYIYEINLSKPETLLRLSVHLQDLMTRYNNKHLLSNPLTTSIKANCPYLFEIAISIASILAKDYHIQISEDEIAYIAINIGSTLDEQRNKYSRITALLYCPYYNDAVRKLINDIDSRFDSKMIFVGIVRNLRNLDQYTNVDLIISLAPVQAKIDMPYVQIRPFLDIKTANQLGEMIDRVHDEKHKKNIEVLLNNIIKEDLFERVEGFSSDIECIRHMAKKVIEKGYEKENYLDDVLEREQLLTTVIEDFAIPHSIHMDATTTVFYVLISENPIPWGGSSVRMVIMLCFSESEKETFGITFEAFTNILENSENFSALLKSRTHSEFLNTIIDILHRQ